VSAAGVTGAPDRDPETARLERLRGTAWYRHPRWTRLAGMLVLGVVLALMFGPDGNPADLLSPFKDLPSVRLVVCLLIGVALWLLAEFREPVARAVAAPRAVVSARAARGRAVLTGNRWFTWGGLAVLAAIAVVVPDMVDVEWQEVLISQMAIYMIIAVGLNVVVGWAGLLDLGFIAFFAIGAYSCAYFTGTLPVKPPFKLDAFEAIPFAVLICLVAGVLLGMPTLRLRGDYLAIVTLGFHEIVYTVAKSADSFTNGPQGAVGIPAFSAHLGPVHYVWKSVVPLPFVYLTLVFLAILVFLYRRLENSRIGRIWTAIREDEVAAAATGVNTVKYKLLAFAIGASTSGLAGVVFSAKSSYINPEDFTVVYSVLALAYVVFGGMGSLPGVLFGAGFLVWLPNALKHYVAPTDRFMYLGALLVLMTIFRPQGVLPSRRRQRELSLAEAGLGDADAVSEPAEGVKG
jgi:branched-chain amino acid transport system permease protein